MTGKIFKSIFIVTLVSLLATIAIIFGITYNYYNIQLGDELKQEAVYVANGVELGDLEYLDTLSDNPMRITLVGSDGKVLFDNQADVTQMANHLDREEIKEALESGTGQSTRYSETISEKITYCAKLLSDGTIIRVASTQYSFWLLLYSMIQPILIVIAIAVILAAIIANGLSKRIVKPINEMNFDNPGISSLYPELQPVIRRLTFQNQKIKNQMQELQMRRVEFDAITSNMSEGMIIINSKAEVLSCNNSARTMLRLGDESDSWNILSSIRSDNFREAIRTALNGKNGIASIHDGDRFYSLITTPVTNDDSSCEGAVIVILDETEKENRERLRREFTANVSHELKTPLTSISGFAELIKNRMTDENDTVRFAENIYTESARLIMLVGDIIKLSQLDDGEIPYDAAQPIDLYDVSKTVISRLSQIAADNGINTELTGEHLSVPGNRKILEEMIYNLCDNAIKYNVTGGSFTVAVNGDDGFATVSVKDTGIGIPADAQGRVFERFYRVDKSHSKETGGTGLGLSIVKHAAAYHHADIRLKSAPGAGTEITLIFKGNN